MATELHRGEIWMYTFAPPDKRRPVLVLSRSSLLRLPLHQVTVVPITSTLRGDPSEVTVGLEEGLKVTSAITLLNIQTVARARLQQFVGTVGPEKMQKVCRALMLAAGCD